VSAKGKEEKKRGRLNTKGEKEKEQVVWNFGGAGEAGRPWGKGV